jgi:hypothetical protein
MVAPFGHRRQSIGSIPLQSEATRHSVAELDPGAAADVPGVLWRLPAWLVAGHPTNSHMPAATARTMIRLPRMALRTLRFTRGDDSVATRLSIAGDR